MASYKILKEVDGLEDVLNMARTEAKWYASKEHYPSEQAVYYKRLYLICATIEALGIVDNGEAMGDELLDEAMEEYGKCNS